MIVIGCQVFSNITLNIHVADKPIRNGCCYVRLNVNSVNGELSMVKISYDSSITVT